MKKFILWASTVTMALIVVCAPVVMASDAIDVRGPSNSVPGGTNFGGCTFDNGQLTCSKLTLNGTISGCIMNPNVDNNFLYYQGCNVRYSTEIRADSVVKIGAAGSLKITDDNTYTATLDLPTKPTVVACSGTAASVTMSGGTASVVFDVGTACAGESTAVLTLPAASNGWLCSCSSTTADRILQQKVIPPANTTTVTMQNIVISTGANGDFTDGADVGCICRGI